MILAVRQSTYTVTNYDVLKTRIKYFYTFISAFVDGNIVNPVVPNIYTIKKTNQLTPLKIKSQPINQNIMIKEFENLPTLMVFKYKFNNY